MARSGSSENERMVGRAPEIEVLRTLPARLSSGPAAVVLQGDAGIGKTTLWLQGIDMAHRGSRVLQARPAEIERQAALSGLADLLDGVDLDALGLPPPTLSTLRRALGDEPSGNPGIAPFAVANAAAELVDALVTAGPVLVAVDDLQWLDAASTRVLGYVLRRLRNRPVGLLVCRRGGDTTNPVITSLPATRLTVLDVAGLGVEEIGELIRRRLAASFLRPRVARIHAATAGNPFYALEVARAVLRQAVPLSSHGPLPMPRELTSLVGRRFEALPGGTREVLLVVAMSQPTTIDLVEKVAGRSARAGLQHALDAGLLKLDSGRVRFAHPLLAETAYAQADGSHRRRLHLELAGAAADVEVRARHLAAAVTLPDEEIAAVLESAASAACARGAPETGAELYARAAELSPADNAADRRRREFGAAEQHALLGHSERALLAYRRLVDELDPGRERARVWQRLGMLERMVGTWSQGMDSLRQGLAEAGSDPALAAELDNQLAICAMQSADLREAGPLIGRARARLRGATPPQIAADIEVAAIMLEVATGAPPKAEWVPLLTRLGSAANERTRLDEDASMRVVEAGCTLKWLDEFDTSRELLGALVKTLWERQQDGLLMPPLFQLCELECWSGRMGRAGELAALLDETCRRAGQRLHQMFHFTNALLHLRTGDLSTAREDASACLEWSQRTGDLRNELRAVTLQGSLELVAGDVEAAVRALDAAAELERAFGYGNPAVVRGAADHIEALLAAGRAEDARRRLATLEEQAERTSNPWAVAVAWRSRGLLAAATGRLLVAVAELERAAELPVADPVERGRTLLALATIQRRTRQRAAARGTAQRALAVLAPADATLWIERVQGELDRLAGGSRWADRLTPMEHEIAARVVAGMTNKEVASTVYVSAKTVEAHLTHIYLKLGVRSRTELARRLHETTPQTRDIPDADRPRRS